MTKEQALKEFFSRNRIDPIKACDKASAEYDPILSALPGKIDCWLSDIAPADRSVFLEALGRYTYLTELECQLRFDSLIQQLEKKLAEQQISLCNTLFVTVESTDGMKSGSDHVRTDLQRRNIDKISKRQIAAAQSKLSQEQLEGVAAVVFVDDIVGTGLTLWRELHHFCDKYEINGKGFPKLYYLCLSPTEKAIRHLNNNFAKAGYIVSAVYRKDWLAQKAFSSHSAEYHVIDRYEKILDDYFKKEPHSYRMGFQKSGLLLSFYYNTPNNTISRFWRPAECNKPPFQRDGKECIRPGVSQLKLVKKQSDANAYAYTCYRREKGKS